MLGVILDEMRMYVVQEFGDTTWGFTAVAPFENGQAKAEMGFVTDVLKVRSVVAMALPSPQGLNE